MNKSPRGQTPARRAYMLAYSLSHPKRDRRAYKAAYDAMNKKRAAAYRAANREKLTAAKAQWYRDNRDQILARVKAYSHANKDRILAYQAEYYETNAEKVKANVAAYRKAYPEKKSVLEGRRRARKVGNGGSHTVSERREKFRQLGNACVYCGSTHKLTVDHDVPLSRGGTDNIENVVPACRSCNSKKNTRTASEYLAVLSRRVGGDSAGHR